MDHVHVAPILLMVIVVALAIVVVDAVARDARRAFRAHFGRRSDTLHSLARGRDAVPRSGPSAAEMQRAEKVAS